MVGKALNPEQVEILRKVVGQKCKAALECGNFPKEDDTHDLYKHYQKMSHQARLEAEAIEQALKELGHG